MKTEMVMPQMGESVAEATILKWHKGVGDEVSKDETILDIATDKVDSEIPAPASGIIVELKAKEGDVVPVKEVIAIIETDAAAAGDAIKEAKSAEPASAPASNPTPAPASAPPAPAAAPQAPQAAAPATTASTGTEIEMLMPQMGESIAEATISRWHKKAGDKVEKDQTILDISTDKVDSEIPAPASGVLLKILAQEGQTVAVKSAIAIIGTAGGVVTANGSAGAATTASQPAQAASAPAAPTSSTSSPVATPPATGAVSSDVPRKYGNKFFTPLVRSLASQYGLSPVELASVPGSGAHGRVTKDDLLLYMQHRGSTAAPVSGSAPAQQVPASQPSQHQPSTPRPEYGEDGTKVVTMDNMRKIIAKHMVMSKATSPHVYSTAECDVTNIALWRKKNQAAFVKREGFKLSFTPFFLEAAVKGLVEYPYVNASIDGENVILKKDINLGCAVALGTGGLIVPVIKKADELSLVGIARSLGDLAGRARDKKLKPDEIQGGTFTVTNPGVFGNIIGNPIINQPQLAILALGAIKKRPMVVNDAIAIRDIIYLTLSYDHRIIDGSLAGQFLNFITKYLEAWDPNRPLY